MVWQAFNPNASGREVVRQLQALYRLESGPKLSPEAAAQGCPFGPTLSFVTQPRCG
jgi:hypothetical protein